MFPVLDDDFVRMFGRTLAPVPDTPWLSESDHAFGPYRGRGKNMVEAILRWASHRDPLFRRNRLQLMRSCPMLVVALSYDDIEPSIGYLDIGVAVDRGDKLIPTLTRLAGVRMGAVRRFCRLVPNEVSEDWTRAPFELLWALHLLFGTTLPTTKDGWAAMRLWWRLSGLAEEQDYGNPENSLAGRTRKFLAEHVFKLLCSVDCSAATLPAPNFVVNCGDVHRDVDRIACLTDYFAYVTEWVEQICPKNGPIWSWERLEPSLSEGLLMRYSLPELLRQTTAWRYEIARRATMRKVHDPESTMPLPESWPSLLQEPYVSGGLQAVSLVCAQELQSEGALLNHCVSNYVGACVVGDTHIVSIRDIEGNRLSTAEIGLLPIRPGHWKPQLLQHRALSNRPPGDDCERLVGEVLHHLEAAEHQAWFAAIRHIHEENRVLLAAHIGSRAHDEECNDIMFAVLPDIGETMGWLERRRREPS